MSYPASPELSLSVFGSAGSPSPASSPSHFDANHSSTIGCDKITNSKPKVNWNKKECKAFKLHFFRGSTTNGDEVICKIPGCPTKEKGFKGIRFSNLKRHVMKLHSEHFCRYNCDLELRQEQETGSSGEAQGTKVLVKFQTTETELMKDLVDLCTVHGSPLEMIDYAAMQHLIKPYVDALGMTVDSQKVKAAIHHRAGLLKDRLRNDSARKFVALKVDCTICHLVPYIGVIIQFIDEGQIKIRMLKCMPMQHTEGGNLGEEIIAILNDYNILLMRIVGAISSIDLDMCNEDSTQISLLGADNFYEFPVKEEEYFKFKGDEGGKRDKGDNAANNSVATIINDAMNVISESGIESISCVAQTLHIAFNHALEMEVFDIELQKIKRLVRKFGNKKLRSLMRLTDDEIPDVKKRTTWSSIYAMLNSLLDLRAIIEEEAPEAMIDMTGEDWENIINIKESLQPCMNATIALQKQDMPFSEVYGIFWKLSKVVERSSTIFSEIIAQEIDKKKDLIMTPILFAAVLLDPRYMKLLDGNQVTLGKTRLCQTWEKILASTADDLPEDGRLSQEIPEDMEIHDADDLDLLAAILENEQSNKSFHATERPTSDDISAMVTAFIRGPRLGLKEDVFAYWSDTRFQHPQLYELAQIFLAIPASQISLEQLSSNLRSIRLNDSFELRDNIFNDSLLIRLDSMK